FVTMRRSPVVRGNGKVRRYGNACHIGIDRSLSQNVSVPHICCFVHGRIDARPEQGIENDIQRGGPDEESVTIPRQPDGQPAPSRIGRLVRRGGQRTHSAPPVVIAAAAGTDGGAVGGATDTGAATVEMIPVLSAGRVKFSFFLSNGRSNNR